MLYLQTCIFVLNEAKMKSKDDSDTLMNYESDSTNSFHGIQIKNFNKSINYYCMRTSTSAFSIIDYLRVLDIDVEDEWQMSQRMENQYLKITALFANETDMKIYEELIKNWIRLHGNTVSNNEFVMPQENLHNESQILKFGISKISKLCQKVSFNSPMLARHYCWDATWTDKAGKGGDDFLYLALNSALPILIVTAMSYLGIATKEQRKYWKEYKQIERYKKEINKRYNFTGIVLSPEVGRHYFDNIYYKILVFEEMYEDKCIAKYYVKHWRRSQYSKPKVSYERELLVHNMSLHSEYEYDSNF